MKFQRRKDIKQQISQLRATLAVQEQGKKLFSQSTEETVGKHKDLIGFLRGNVREGMHELHLSLKHEQVIINQACQERKRMKIVLADLTMEKAREMLSNYVFDRMNLHNLLLYEVKKRGHVLQQQQLRLQSLTDLETASPQGLLQLQTIRQLENNIEKMLVKVSTGQKANGLYLKMADLLKDELAQLPFLLDSLERMVEIYAVELKGMSLMATDTMEAMEAAKLDMVNMETEFVAEKKFRENSLSIQKKQIERIRAKDASERHRRMQARRDLNMDFPTLMGRDALRGAKLEASKAQIEYQSLVTTQVEKVKCAVQCSHLWDIAGRFIAQKKFEENLQQQIGECEKKRKELKAQLRELEVECAELKFHQTPSSISSRKLEEELKRTLEEEESRRQEVRAQVFKKQELLLLFENGVDNLVMRLCGISLPSQQESPVDMGDVFGKLQFCEMKLMHMVTVMSKMHSYEYSQDESNETFVHVRNFLEESTRDGSQNLRICFEDEDEDVREAFNFSDIDHSYVPNRDEIKKQGLKLIDDKTKVTKKKRGSVKKL